MLEREPLGYALFEEPYFIGAWKDIEIARAMAVRAKCRSYRILPIYDEPVIAGGESILEPIT